MMAVSQLSLSSTEALALSELLAQYAEGRVKTWHMPSSLRRKLWYHLMTPREEESLAPTSPKISEVGTKRTRATETAD